MRDKARINKILKIVKDIWEENPDLRFVQLVENVTTNYYIEDDEFVERLKDTYKKGNG